MSATKKKREDIRNGIEIERPKTTNSTKMAAAYRQLPSSYSQLRKVKPSHHDGYIKTTLLRGLCGQAASAINLRAEVTVGEKIVDVLIAIFNATVSKMRELGQNASKEHKKLMQLLEKGAMKVMEKRIKDSPEIQAKNQKETLKQLQNDLDKVKRESPFDHPEVQIVVSKMKKVKINKHEKEEPISHIVT